LKTLTLSIQKGGLGDHLFYSHLPRIAKQYGGFNQVYISNDSIFRNPDTKKLVWELNPYLDGFTNDPGFFYFSENIQEGENLLDHLMLAYGLDDHKRNHEPEIYYKPKLVEALIDKTIYDPNYISYTGDIKYPATIQNWFDQNNIIPNAQMKVLGGRAIRIVCANTQSTPDIFKFCDLLYSAKAIYCLSTGTGTLAAALQKPVTVLYGEGLQKAYRHSGLHSYINVGTDFTLLDRAKKWLTKQLGYIMPLGKK
jgi:hypothetical protein